MRIWKRLKPLWIALLGWLLAGAVILALLWYGLFDLRGGLPAVEISSSQTISAEDVRALSVAAEGVAVEIGSSYDIGEIQVQLYGTGYVNQRAVWQLKEDGVLQIRLDSYPVVANAYGTPYDANLTMRILLPKRSYDAIVIAGQRLDVALYQCKAKRLVTEVAHGSVFLQKADLQRADLISHTAEIAVQRSRIHYLHIENQKGDTNLLDNQLRYWNYNSNDGDLEVLTGSIQGIWELSSQRGDLHIGTKKWHNNLWLDLHTQQGTVTASSKKKPWKKEIAAALTEHDLQLLEGRGENMLLVRSQTGDILLDTVKFTQ